jgi:hypothetical protein
MNAKTLLMFGAIGVVVFFLYPIISGGKAIALFNSSGGIATPGSAVSDTSSGTTTKLDRLTKYAQALGSIVTAFQKQSDSRPVNSQVDYLVNPSGAPVDYT